jgi:hypothetical protein
MKEKYSALVIFNTRGEDGRWSGYNSYDRVEVEAESFSDAERKVNEEVAERVRKVVGKKGGLGYVIDSIDDSKGEHYQACAWDESGWPVG